MNSVHLKNSRHGHRQRGFMESTEFLKFCL